MMVSVSVSVGVSGEVVRSGSSAWAASRQKGPRPRGGWNVMSSLSSLPHHPPDSKLLLHTSKKNNLIKKITQQQ